MQFLECYTPRTIPVGLKGLDTVISYSDGEGAKAGLGIAMWSSRCPNGPLAAFTMIPDRIRDLWDRQGAEERNDIYCVEAIGPLAILETWPNIVKSSLWLHFIDNSAAQHALIRGSSSVRSGDVIVGEPWRSVQSLGVYFYVDRVESEANPVDGLSRERFAGPWLRVVRARLPSNLEALLMAEMVEG